MTSDRSTVPGLPFPQGRGEDPFLHYTKIYLSFLQGLFSQFEPGCWRWAPSEEDSEIAITDQVPLPQDRIEQRPALVTVRGPAQFANLSLDSLRHVDWKTGEKTHTDLVSCTMTINCIAKLGTESSRLAWIVLRHIRALKLLLQRQGIHKIDDRLSISSETPPGALVELEPDSEITNVVVSSPFFFQWTEKVRPTDAPVAESIEAHMSANLQPPEAATTRRREQDVYLKQPTINGVPIKGASVPITSLKQTVKT